MVKLFPTNGVFNDKSILGGEGKGKIHFQCEGCELTEIPVQEGMGEAILNDQTPLTSPPEILPLKGLVESAEKIKKEHSKGKKQNRE